MAQFILGILLVCRAHLWVSSVHFREFRKVEFILEGFSGPAHFRQEVRAHFRVFSVSRANFLRGFGRASSFLGDF